MSIVFWWRVYVICGSLLVSSRHPGPRLRPPTPPCFSGGLRPPDPPKRRSTPLAAMVVRFLATEPIVRGSFAAWGRTFSQNPTFLEQATCPGQLRCSGQNFFLRSRLSFVEQATCPGQLRCLGHMFSQKCHFFRNKPLVQGSMI